MAKIALTFNDAPTVTTDEQGTPLGTAELLRVIEDLNSQLPTPLSVTFFVVGERLQAIAEQYPDLIPRLKQGGHEIANAGFTAQNNFHQLSVEDVLAEIRQAHQLITEIFDQPPRYFRPPGGLLSLEAETAIQEAFPDYQLVGWDRHDEKGQDTPQQFRDRFLQHVHDQQVVMLHDWRKPTLWAIRDIFTALHQRSFQCVSLSHLDRTPPRYGLRHYAPPNWTQPRIALTFDDDPKVLTQDGIKLGTRELLRVINELNATASTPIRVTFFVVGVNLEKAIDHYPDVLEAMREGGHEIANHSYSHPPNFHQLPVEKALDEVRRNHDLIVKLFQREPRYFRPPKGFINPINHQAILKAFPQYEIAGWDRHDEKDHYSADQLRQVVVDNAGDQQIVLLHVWYRSSLWAMRNIFQDLQARQYQLVTLSDLDRTPSLYGLKNGNLPYQVA